MDFRQTYIPSKGRTKYKTSESTSKVATAIYTTNSGSGSGGTMPASAVTKAAVVGALGYVPLSAINKTSVTTALGYTPAKEGSGEWYTLQLERDYDDPDVIKTHLEGSANFTNLSDTSKYRVVLCQWRGYRREGKRWRYPMFSPAWDCDTGTAAHGGTEMTMSFTDTWWQLNDRVQPMWYNRNKKWTDVISHSVDTVKHHFKGVKNKKKRFGCCIMKKSAGGKYGWHRVSNIAVVELYCTSGNEILKNFR